MKHAASHTAASRAEKTAARAVPSGSGSGESGLFLSRELSWLDFNERVLDEAACRANPLLERLKFAEHKDTLVSSLPLGWKQKLAFSVSIFHEPGVVFLDEPTGGVDPATRRQFWQLIYDAASRGITVFVTTHYMDEAEYCDRISIMVDGKISAIGTPKELKEQFRQPDMDHVFTYLARQAKRKDE